MTILGGSNVSGERIPGGSGNKEESGTRVGVRPGRRDKLERAPHAGVTNHLTKTKEILHLLKMIHDQL